MNRIALAFLCLLACAARGEERVLFAFDDHAIPWLQNLKLTMVPAEKHPANPVLRRGAEGAPDHGHAVLYGTVIKDGAKFRMWYLGMFETQLEKGNAPGYWRPMCYAESDDGVRWTKPELGLVEFNGSTRNNICLVEGEPQSLTRVDDFLSVLHEPGDPDPARRYKCAYIAHVPWEDARGGIGASRPGKRVLAAICATSADGLRWRVVGDRPANAGGEHFEVSSLYRFGDFYYFTGQSLLGWRDGAQSGRHTMRVYRSPDFAQWSQATASGFARPEQLTNPPSPREQTHMGAGLWNRGNVLVGLYGMWHDAETPPAKGESFNKGVRIDLGLIVSNDGVHFREPVASFKVLARGEPGAWDDIALLQGNAFVNEGERTMIWYSHWDTSGGLRSMDIGLATLRRDGFGFLSPVANERDAQLVTETFSARSLSVNLDGITADAPLTAELLDHLARPLDGYTTKLAQNGVRVPIAWPKPLPPNEQVALRLRWPEKSAAKVYAIYAGDDAHEFPVRAGIAEPIPVIIVDQASPEIFPAVWLSEKINAKAEPLDAAVQQECREIVSKALAKYPVAVLSANLKKVYVVGGLSYSGVPAAGTRSASAVYVVRKATYSAAQVEGIFHAEFSSILLQNFPRQLDQAAWQQINPPDFHYRGSGVQAVKSKQASLRTTDELCEEGFLNEYSKASIEEDFNSYAARLLMGDVRLWDAIEKFPKVKAKAELTMAFYGKLNAAFTKEFFSSLRATTTRPAASLESAGEIERAEISEIVLKHFSADAKGGVAVLVVKDGQVLHRKGYGSKDGAPITPDTPMGLASVTKQFTAMCAAFLIEEGKLKLTDKVSQHLPEVNLHVEGRELLVQDLLWHISGLPNFLGSEYRDSIDAFKKTQGLARFTNETHAQWLATLPLRRAPGTEFEYTNSGYVLLARIIEVIAGKPFHEFQQERIFDPLGMTQTSDSATFNGSGNMSTSLNDYAKWDRALCNGTLVKPETWKLMVQSGTLDNGEPVGYGFGWRVTYENGELVEMQHGGTGSPPSNSRNMILRDLRHRITVVFFSRENPQFNRELKPRIAEEIRDCAIGLK